VVIADKVVVATVISTEVVVEEVSTNK